MLYPNRRDYLHGALDFDLEFERRGGRTVLSARRHDGPLVVQKTLYPEGDEVCHAIVVHPPGGIAGGDDLQINARLDANAHALLTTPGAGKWYRSAGPAARQSIQFDANTGACLEWLPQENIIFAGARAELRTEVHLTERGQLYRLGNLLSWAQRVGRTLFSNGSVRARTLIDRTTGPLWLENAQLEGGAAALQSPVVLAGHSVVGTRWPCQANWILRC